MVRRTGGSRWKVTLSSWHKRVEMNVHAESVVLGVVDFAEWSAMARA